MADEVTNNLHPFKAKIISLIGKAPEEVNDDEILDFANQKFDELQSVLDKIEAAKKELEALVETDPLLGAILSDFSKGASFQEALARHVTPEDLVPPEGEADESIWEKAKQERLQKYQELEANKQNFLKSVEEFAQENELSEEDVTNLLGYIDSFIDKAFNYSITKEDLNNFYALLSGIGETKDKAEKLKAINEKVNDKMGDGLPDASSTPTNVSVETKKVGLYDWIKSRR